MRYLLLVILLGAALAGLWAATAPQEKTDEVSYGRLNIAAVAGRQLFALKKCAECHTRGETAEGERTPVRNQREQAWFVEHVQQESPIVLRQEKSRRKQRRVLKAELAALEAYLYGIEPAARKLIDAMPDSLAHGAYLVYQNNCTNCHTIGGFGKDIAPDLSAVGKKRDKTWLIANLKNPKAFSPETLMPPFDQLPEVDLENIADYLLTLR